MNIPLPRWIDSLSAPHKDHAKQRFLLRMAALHASESGTLAALTEALGRSKNALTRHVCADPEPVSVELAIEIESLVGRAVLPREALRPDIFLIPGS